MNTVPTAYFGSEDFENMTKFLIRKKYEKFKFETFSRFNAIFE